MSFYDEAGRLALEMGLPKALCMRLFRAVLEEIGGATEAGPVHIPGFGTFYRSTRKARRIRNPATKQLMELPETYGLGFRAAKSQKGHR